jgi:hypothetical protein
MTILATDIRCAIQEALLGLVSPNLRAVNVLVDDNDFMNLLLYYDLPPDEDEQELASLIDLEFFVFFAGDKNDYKIITLPYPQQIPRVGYRVYQRYEAPIK